MTVAPSRYVLLLACVFCLGCAAGRIVRPDGTTVSGIVVGAAALEVCEPGGGIGPGTSSVAGALLGGCARIDGGTISSTFATMIGGLVSAASLYFGGWF